MRGNLLEEPVEAIVNAANGHLAHGGGVAGFISRAAGPSLQQESDRIVQARGPLPTGSAVVTTAGKLPFKGVIHAVGPIYRPDDSQVAALLASAYRRSLEIAVENGLVSIAFPAISTGVYGFPKQQAAEIAVRTVLGYHDTDHPFIHITFCCFSQDDLQRYETLLARLRL